MDLFAFLLPLILIVIALVIFLVLLQSISRAYVKTPANRAFVRTGGLFQRANALPKVVMNGGAWVFNIIHEITWVDLGTMAIEIERTEHNALLTVDPQYADIKAIFYIKVNPTVEGVIDAARTIGGKQVDSNAVKQLVDAKLDGALRDVAASFTLMSLHQEREKFIQEVQSRLKTDLQENGLVLESVSILTLRAARQGSFNTDDVFGAQVARANAQVIQQALKERNDIERQTEIEIKQRDISASKLRLDLDRDLALATAAQEREVRMMQATEKSRADTMVYEEVQKAETARVAKEKAVALLELQRERDLSLQNELTQQDVMSAEVVRRQAVELAEQQRQIRILQEQQKRESAEQQRLKVSAEREEAAQTVLSVQATQAAQREAKIKVIEAEREAQKAMIEQKNRIELDALRRQREAEAQALALKEIAAAEAVAALKQAETLRTQAQAEVEAEKLRAEAAKAKASAAGLAEADVQKARAEASMREAEAIRAQGLAQAEAEKAKAEALAAFDGVAQRVELMKLQLDAQVRIEIAKAQALGSAMASMNLKLIGDPQAAASLLRMVTLADGLGEVVKATPQPVREVGQQLLNKLTGDADGKALLNMGDSTNPASKDDDAPSLAELAQLLPKLMPIAEANLDLSKMQGKSVEQAMKLLEKKVSGADLAVVQQAQGLLAHLPIFNGMPFEEVYLRINAK
ncbi:MAG TPA: SPFH domain-containing protein [Anaerolineales bacterium]|nr:SPFH domain-containing protein [Anaerolineales bacterium]